MNERSPDTLFDDGHSDNESVARGLLDQLLTDARLYRNSDSYKELLSFVSRLRNVAPYNAMLLQLQKPSITYVASAYDWNTRFNRRPREGARPLLILWPFGPVATVYDVQDTEGDALPEDAFAFPASGLITASRINSFVPRLRNKNIEWTWVDAGDSQAGAIRVIKRGDGESTPTRYRMKINRNHEPAVQFTTVAHELGHLFLGHLGEDKKLSISKHRPMSHANVELEAESVAFLVCERNGVRAKSETYLSYFVNPDTDVDSIDVFRIMRAAGRVESMLELTDHTRFKVPKS